MEETDWGFTHFMKLAQLIDPTKGYIKDDRLMINVEIELVKELQVGNWSGYWNYDSKKETG